MIEPRVSWTPKGRKTELGRRVVDFCGENGLVLDEWQAYVVEQGFKRRGDRWAAFEVGLDVPRQNGKGAILEAVMLGAIYLCHDRFVVYSAHMFDTAMEAFRRMEYLVLESKALRAELATSTDGRRTTGIRRMHGEEGIHFRGDRRLRFRTRSRGGGRGFTGDRLLLDECMFMPEFTHGALLPTLSARPDPQVWYVGSAVDQQIHEHGIVFTRIRERGLKGDDPTLAWFEWSVDGDNPDTVPDGVALDQAAWAEANPALGIRIRPVHVEAEQRSMDPRTFAVERLGVGDWPRTDHMPETVISLEQWRELQDPNSVLLDPVCLAFDVSPERKASIAAAGLNQAGLYHVEIMNDAEGTAWLPDRLEQLVKQHRPQAVVCDGYGPAASLIPVLEQKGIHVETKAAGEHAQACGRFLDLVRESKLRHLGSLELAGAVHRARTRPLGDAWAWSRRHSDVNISPLVSATLAVDAAQVGIGASVYDERGIITL